MTADEILDAVRHTHLVRVAPSDMTGVIRSAGVGDGSGIRGHVTVDSGGCHIYVPPGHISPVTCQAKVEGGGLCGKPVRADLWGNLYKLCPECKTERLRNGAI